MASKAITAWGEAALLEEITLPQAAGERQFAAVVQLLAAADGGRYVRFAYTTDGIARRGPVTLREEDVARLHAELVDHPELAAALGLPAAAASRRRRVRGL